MGRWKEIGFKVNKKSTSFKYETVSYYWNVMNYWFTAGDKNDHVIRTTLQKQKWYVKLKVQIWWMIILGITRKAGKDRTRRLSEEGRGN